MKPTYRQRMEGIFRDGGFTEPEINGLLEGVGQDKGDNMKHTEILEACVNAESAMFHVLADRGFNSHADRDAMEHALLGIRKVIKGINPEAVGELLKACKNAMRLVDLWLPANVKPEHAEEARGLSFMCQCFEQAIAKAAN